MGKHGTAKTLRLATLALSIATTGGGCSQKSSGSNSAALPPDVQAIVFVQRKPRTDAGNVFEYTSYVPGGRLVMLSPPSADGTLTDLTALAAKTATLADPANPVSFEGADIMSYDLSFDAKAVVFSARLGDSDRYQIFTMNLDGTELKQLTNGGNDYVYPTFLPGGKIFFTSNRNVESEPTGATYAADSKQFVDEYERATTAQVGTMNLDGSNQQLGPRNVSHRVSPTLLPDGHVLYTEWRHLGNVNDGHLRMMNTDMTGMREAFGGEDGGNGGTNSYLKARYVQTLPQLDKNGQPDPSVPANQQLVAIATSRDRTLQSGKLFLIDLNGTEHASHFTDLTPLVPGGREQSAKGRYYDAETVGDPSARQFLVSWADGPVESEVLALAGTQANFGVYLFDGKTGLQYPVYDDAAYWDVLARPVKPRAEPQVTDSAVSGGTSTTIGALNVYDSSVLKIAPGSVQKVRLIEGFSAEEGIRTFGTTEFDGQSRYDEIPLKADNSFAAAVPGNVPFHIQLIDKFAMSVANESIWISGRAGEKRFCGGCHEDRAKTPALAPGQTENVLAAAVNLDVPRAQRITPMLAGTTNFDFSYEKIRGVPWDKAIQPTLDTKCVSCHDGDATKPGNRTFTITDMTSGTSQTFTFDLRGDKLNVVVGERMTGAFSASYISIMGLGEILGEDVVTITGDYKNGYTTPGSAKDSDIIKKLNPPQRFPAIDTKSRAFAAGGIHPNDVGHPEWELTPEEYYRMILNIDMGGQFFFRENRDGADADPYKMGGI
jgi:hypothetical protein